MKTERPRHHVGQAIQPAAAFPADLACRRGASGPAANRPRPGWAAPPFS